MSTTNLPPLSLKHLQYMFSRLLKRSTLLLSATSAMSAMTKDSMNPEYIVRKVSLATGLPPAHHGPNGVFHNPWPSFSNRTFWDSMSWLTQRKQEPINDPYEALLTVPLDLKSIQGLYEHDNISENTPLTFSWLGHAAVLITTLGLNILFDPCLSDRCSPVSFAGPKRLHPIPCAIDELPKPDAIVLSHSHYDHTDLPMLKRIAAPHTQFFVPLGMGPILKSVGFVNVAEGDWWDSFEFEKRESIGRVRKATIACTPAQHFSNRGLLDFNKSLWASWVFKTGDKSFFFAGDTGYRSVEKGMSFKEETALPVCPEFKKIGEKYGPFDLAAIPIGAYSPRWFMSPVHTDPWDAVCLHKDIRSKRSIGMHWGTYHLSDEPVHEPPVLLKEARKLENVTEAEFGVIKLGESITV